MRMNNSKRTVGHFSNDEQFSLQEAMGARKKWYLW